MRLIFRPQKSAPSFCSEQALIAFPKSVFLRKIYSKPDNIIDTKKAITVGRRRDIPKMLISLKAKGVDKFRRSEVQNKSAKF